MSSSPSLMAVTSPRICLVMPERRWVGAIEGGLCSVLEDSGKPT